MHALLLLNGCTGVPHDLNQSSFDLIIAADGGCRNLPDGIIPHIICGDFDSLDPDTARTLAPTAEIVHLADQSSSDLEKALNLALERGATRLTLTKAIGGRIDHVMSVASTLIRYHTHAELTVIEEGSSLRLLSPNSRSGPSIKLACRPNDILSLIPFSPDVQVSIEKVQWPLVRQRIMAGTGAISNRATADEIPITVHSGILCVCHLDARWADR